MGAAATIDAVREMVMDALNLHEEYDPEEIEAEAQLFGDDGLGLDSLDALQLAVAIEERYGVTIDENEGQKVFRSVSSILAHIQERAAS